MSNRSRSLRRGLRDSGFGRWAAARLISGYLRLCRRTTWWRRDGWENVAELVASERPFILAVWHGRLVMVAPFRHETPLPILALISNNRDGDLIAAVLERFNVDAARGSSYNPRRKRSKGGAEALIKVIDALKTGSAAAITPDGPRGPRMRAQSGIARAAIAAGAPVLCVGFSTRGGWMLKSWDRFLLPRPFTRGAAAFAPVIEPPVIKSGLAEGGDAARDAVERLRLRVEETLNTCQRRADAITGRMGPEPGAAPERDLAPRNTPEKAAQQARARHSEAPPPPIDPEKTAP